jgi:hypothetical protein
VVCYAPTGGGKTRSTGRERVGHVNGRDHGVTVIDGGWPLHVRPDGRSGHKFMRWMYGLTGKLPKDI